MDFNKQLNQKLTALFFLILVFAVGVAAFLWLLTAVIFEPKSPTHIFAFGALLTFSLAGTAFTTSKVALKPLKILSEAIVFSGHNSRGGIGPDPEKLKLGRELITSLVRQVYDLSQMAEHANNVVSVDATTNQNTVIAPSQSVVSQPSAPQSSSILNHIGLPIIGIDQKQNITTINRTCVEYLGKKPEEMIGKPLYDALSLAFQGEETFEQWLKNSQANTAVGTRIWERVRITNSAGEAVKQFDLVASFSKDNQSGTETMLTIYDRTEQYARDDSEISFVALAVHELRTPLTVMRGYIEVFEDEVGPSLSPELQGFMNKMQASAEQLTAFIGNILNVARNEENQLVLKLQQHSWPDILNMAVKDLELRAKVHNKRIELQTADNLPAVAADRISIHEVINNLVDNSIKYSGNSERILITSSVNAEGMVEISVQDFGIGIPEAVMPELFQKFHRSHKSKVQVGGTGLGLYLCKALVGAHGGNIWVRSKEGEGSIFTFTLQPYDSVKHEQAEGQDGIMRGAHGWIKNHSLNRQ